METTNNKIGFIQREDYCSISGRFSVTLVVVKEVIEVDELHNLDNIRQEFCESLEDYLEYEFLNRHKQVRQPQNIEIDPSALL